MSGGDVEDADVIQDTEFFGVDGVGLVAHSAENDKVVIPWREIESDQRRWNEVSTDRHRRCGNNALVGRRPLDGYEPFPIRRFRGRKRISQRPSSALRPNDRPVEWVDMWAESVVGRTYEKIHL